jgi:hypothetical protein
MVTFFHASRFAIDCPKQLLPAPPSEATPGLDDSPSFLQSQFFDHAGFCAYTRFSVATTAVPRIAGGLQSRRLRDWSPPLEELDAMAKDTGNLTRIVDIVESSVDALTTFRSQKAKHLAGWWMTANGGRMPTRAMFDIADHRPIVANLFLVDVLPEGEFLFKLLGEVVIQ